MTLGRLSLIAIVLFGMLPYGLAQGGQTDDLKQLRTTAEQGSPNAQFYLGVMYEAGQGVPQDYAEALG